ncbi:MAG: hypothetical protein WCS99_12060 [Limisphaerales bacterium]
MKKITQSVLLAGAFTALGLITTATAQEQKAPQRGGFNPEEMRARMTERVRELLDVKNEDEWKLIQTRLEKTQEAQREVRSLSGDLRLLFSQGGDQGGERRPGRGGPGSFGGTPNPDSEALSKAVQAKSPTDELKQRLARVREARKAAEAKYEKAADDLRQVLTVRQEATLVAIGLLK